MLKGSIPRRYARALILIAKEENKIKETGDELMRFKSLIEERKDLWNSLQSPLFTRDMRERVIFELSKHMGISEIVCNFLRLLNEKGRLEYLYQIIQFYLEMLDEALGRINAVLETARELSPDEEERLVSVLERRTGKKVVLEKRLNPDLISGVVIKIGGWLFDGSLRTQLNRIKEELVRS